MSLPIAIIFDLDDTIITYDAVVEKTSVAVCQNYAGKHPGVDAGELREAIRRQSDRYWADPERHRIGRANIEQTRRQIIRSAFSDLSLPEADATELADGYSRQRLADLELFPKAMATLEELQQRRVRLALLSNGEAHIQRQKIDKFVLADHFEHICIEGEQGFGKPEHCAFTNVLEKMKLDAGDVWMVGDSLTFDIAPAQELGIYAIWHDWRSKGLPESSSVSPDKIITDLSELL